MKLSLESTSQGVRRGLISQWEGRPVSIPTPLPLIYTRGGLLPHLTHEMAERTLGLEPEASIYLLSLPTLADAEPCLAANGKGDVREYCALRVSLFMTPSKIVLEARSLAAGAECPAELHGPRGAPPARLQHHPHERLLCQGRAAECHSFLSS